MFKIAENHLGAHFHMWDQNLNACNLYIVVNETLSGLVYCLKNQVQKWTYFRLSIENRRDIFVKVVGFFVKNRQDMKKITQQNYNNCLTKNFFTISFFLIPSSIKNNLIYLFIAPSQTGLNQKHSFLQQLSRVYLRVGEMARNLGSLILKVLILYLRERDCPSLCLTSTNRVFYIICCVHQGWLLLKHHLIASYEAQISWDVNLYWLEGQERDLWQSCSLGV